MGDETEIEKLERQNARLQRQLDALHNERAVCSHLIRAVKAWANHGGIADVGGAGGGGMYEREVFRQLSRYLMVEVSGE